MMSGEYAEFDPGGPVPKPMAIKVVVTSTDSLLAGILDTLTNINRNLIAIEAAILGADKNTVTGTKESPF